MLTRGVIRQRWFLMREAFLEKLELPSLGPTDQEMKTGPSAAAATCGCAS